MDEAKYPASFQHCFPFRRFSRSTLPLLSCFIKVVMFGHSLWFAGLCNSFVVCVLLGLASFHQTTFRIDKIQCSFFCCCCLKELGLSHLSRYPAATYSSSTTNPDPPAAVVSTDSSQPWTMMWRMILHSQHVWVRLLSGKTIIIQKKEKDNLFCSVS